MEKLKGLILEKINNDIVLSNQDAPWRYAPEYASEKLADLVKDIAIEFANYSQNYCKDDRTFKSFIADYKRK